MTTRDRDRRDDPPGFDVGGTFRQLGTAETGNGLQNGLAAVAVGLLAALILYPIARLRRGTSKRESPSR
jgi:hypothetical protein